MGPNSFKFRTEGAWLIYQFSLSEVFSLADNHLCPLLPFFLPIQPPYIPISTSPYQLPGNPVKKNFEREKRGKQEKRSYRTCTSLQGAGFRMVSGKQGDDPRGNELGRLLLKLCLLWLFDRQPELSESMNELKIKGHDNGSLIQGSKRSDDGISKIRQGFRPEL
jgi:hypothetical protein